MRWSRSQETGTWTKSRIQCCYKRLVPKAARRDPEDWAGKPIKPIRRKTTSVPKYAAKRAFPAIQLVGLLPQRVRLELPERRLNPGTRLWIRRDASRRKCGAAEQAQLAAEEEASAREEQVRGEVAKGCGFDQWCYVRDWL